MNPRKSDETSQLVLHHTLYYMSIGLRIVACYADIGLKTNNNTNIFSAECFSDAATTQSSENNDLNFLLATQKNTGPVSRQLKKINTYFFSHSRLLLEPRLKRTDIRSLGKCKLFSLMKLGSLLHNFSEQFTVVPQTFHT